MHFLSAAQYTQRMNLNAISLLKLPGSGFQVGLGRSDVGSGLGSLSWRTDCLALALALAASSIEPD